MSGKEGTELENIEGRATLLDEEVASYEQGNKKRQFVAGLTGKSEFTRCELCRITSY